jgi:hypothetical protein
MIRVRGAAAELVNVSRRVDIVDSPDSDGESLL